MGIILEGGNSMGNIGEKYPGNVEGKCLDAHLLLPGKRINTAESYRA